MKITRTAALTAATLVLALSPTAAHAASYHHSDPAHDVVTLNDDEVTTTPAPSRDNGDILTSAVTYGPRRITMAMSYASLDQTDDLMEQYFSVATSKGKVRDFIVAAASGHRQGSVIKLTGRGKKFTCKGVHWSIRYGARTVSLSVPARCLGQPKWVRTAMASFAVDTSTSQAAMVFLDDSMRTGTSGNGNPAYGPRVHR